MRPDWQSIDTVLLDMDGTLLDLNFDNHFWQHHLPHRYAEHHGMTVEDAKSDLVPRFAARTGTLDWYSVDFWTQELGIDLMRFKEEVAHLIAIHPGVAEFLPAARAAGKRVLLVTNAHHKSLTLKMARTGLEVHFDAMLTSHELGLPKEDVTFWDSLQTVHPFDPARTLLIDDTISVLDSARTYGIAHLRAIDLPDTQQPPKPAGAYPALKSFFDLLPII